MAWRFFTENWRIKLFSLGIAVALYTFVNFDNGTAVNVDFRIEYRTPDDIMITNTPPAVVHTTLKGPGARWRSLDPPDLPPVVLDFSRAEPGVQRRSIDLASISAPSGLKVIDIKPAEVEVEFDRRVEGQVPVRPDITEAPALGFEILDVRVLPARVRVVGPGSKMQNLDYVTTRNVDVTGREQDLTLEVDLRPPPPPLILLDKRVSVFVEIGEEFVQRTFQDIPVHLEGAPKNSRMSPTNISLTVKGPRRTVDKMQRSAVDAVVRIGDEVGRGEALVEKTIELRQPLPERTQIMAPVPKVAVRIPHGHRSRKRSDR
jgi:YbbR domain-containing protein